MLLTVYKESKYVINVLVFEDFASQEVLEKASFHTRTLHLQLKQNINSSAWLVYVSIPLVTLNQQGMTLTGALRRTV